MAISTQLPDMSDFGKVYDQELKTMKNSQDPETDLSLHLALLDNWHIRAFCYDVTKKMIAKNIEAKTNKRR